MILVTGGCGFIGSAFVLGWHAPRYARLRRRVLGECEPLLWGGKPW